VTWFKIDDAWSTHPKTRKAGRDGRALWVHAGVGCGKARTSGVVAPHLLPDYAYLADVRNPARAATALVDAGLWHDHESLASCPDCSDLVELEPGAFYFHDWTKYQPTKDDVETPADNARWKRRKALSRDRGLCERICERDRNQCRYCGTRVNWQARRGPSSGTYDHVDPDGENTYENVVVACRRCNGRKRDRTPEEAGMPLLPVPGPYVPGPGPRPETGQVDDRPGPDPDLASRARHAGDGTGQDGAGSDPGLGPDLAGPGQDGADGDGAGGGYGSGGPPETRPDPPEDEP
jgi:hypothetical protein